MDSLLHKIIKNNNLIVRISIIKKISKRIHFTSSFLYITIFLESLFDDRSGMTYMIKGRS